MAELQDENNVGRTSSPSVRRPSVRQLTDWKSVLHSAAEIWLAGWLGCLDGRSMAELQDEHNVGRTSSPSVRRPSVHQLTDWKSVLHSAAENSWLACR